MKQRALPPVPSGCDEYVEMRSYSVSKVNNDAPGDSTARYVTQGNIQFGLQHPADSSNEITKMSLGEEEREVEKEGNKSTDKRGLTVSIEEYIDMTRGSRTSSSIGDPTPKSWCSSHVSSTSC